MQLAAIDSALARLRETVGAMSTNLVDLETDASRTRLDQSPLTGTTAARWTEAHAALACLWQWFTQLNDVLEKATQLRGTRPRLDAAQLAQVEWLVNGPSIELSTADVPLAQRGLFGPAETTVRCAPPELLDRMRTAFDQVVAVIGACSNKWSVVDATLRPLEAQLADADRLAADLGEQHHPELDRARSEIDRLRQVGMCDPLAAPDDALDGLQASLASVADDLRRLAQVRDNLATRLGEARALMADLRATTTAAAEARTEALTKIAHPSVVESQPVAGNAEAELERVVSLSADGDWRAAGNLLVQWTSWCGNAMVEAERALAANRAPVEARDELRGRLDAYRAKAYRIGLLEDPAVASLYARAKAMLYTAPTDLASAQQLVERYQQVLTGAAREVAT